MSTTTVTDDNLELKTIDFDTIQIETSSPAIFRFYFIIAFLLMCFYGYRNTKPNKIAFIGYLVALVISICLIIQCFRQKQNEINLIFPVFILLMNLSNYFRQFIFR